MMVYRVVFWSLFTLTLGMTAPLLAPSARADALLDQALTAGDRIKPQIIIRTGIDYNQDGSIKAQTRARFDPTLPPGKQWALLDINGQPPTRQQKSEFERTFKNNTLPPRYTMVKALIPATAQKISETPTVARYRVNGMPAGSTIVNGKDVSRFLAADVVIDKKDSQPYIREIAIAAPKSFSPLVGSTVKNLERSLLFKIDANGAPILAEHKMSGNGRILVKTIYFRSIAWFDAQAMTQNATRQTTTPLSSLPLPNTP